MIFSGILIVVGFILLIFGADWMVDGAAALAKKYRVSDLAIGLTIVAFGTSAPELVVNTVASFEGYSDIILGNVIGSNLFNLFVILGIVGIILPITVKSTTVWKEIPISFLAIVVLFIVAEGYLFQSSNIISRGDGIILMILFLAFLYYVYTLMQKDVVDSEILETHLSMAKIWGLIILGLAGLIIGGKLVVDNAVVMAENFGVSQKVIGLTIIAAGTSLPELVTSVVAALKKNSDIAIGNIIGSNIFNIFLVLSLSSMIQPIQYNVGFNKEIYLLGAGTIFLFIAMFSGVKKRLDRWEAGLLLATYIIYTIMLLK